MVQAKLEGYERPVEYQRDLRGLAFGAVRRSRIDQQRKGAILRLASRMGRRVFCRSLYGALVQRSAEKGWPLITWRRFAQVLVELEREGRILRDVRSFGRYGRRTIVQIRAPEVRTE